MIDHDKVREYRVKILQTERAKLRAVQDKLPPAIMERNIPRIVGLALSAERIAARLEILLTQEYRK